MQLLKLFCVGKSFQVKELHTKHYEVKTVTQKVGPMLKNLKFITQIFFIQNFKLITKKFFFNENTLE